MKKILPAILIIAPLVIQAQLFVDPASRESIAFMPSAIYVDDAEQTLVKKSAVYLQKDIEAVTGKHVPVVNNISSPVSSLIIVGTLQSSALIKELINTKRIDPPIDGVWEAFHIEVMEKPMASVSNALVIAGSDRRGCAFGVFEVSKQMGVSPWYWWADVPVKKKTNLALKKNAVISDAPKVKYRGIFINDEAPALSGWTKEKFGGFNHRFYEKVFELMLRLKSNYIWPAMWGKAFYYDDSLNIKMADDHGIVIGTSHHEPLMRAHEEWKYFGEGRKWNYDSTEAGLKEYWRGGLQRAWNEKIITIGMRGDGDEPMTRETATALLERIVKDQRQIIEDVTGKPASETPQIWALYKEVQDYYDKGMRVPDDVTLLLCDDNWGNIRRLPKPGSPPRKGGYGIYYHFDYVGGPRNYKWVNTNPLPRIWEQMHLAWQHDVKNIWIVNVGDIKPMEFPISFFLDYAWNPERIDADDLRTYTRTWCEAQFGKQHAASVAELLSLYAKYNSRRKPELLDQNTFNLHNYNEFTYVTREYGLLLEKAISIKDQLDPIYHDAYFQLVLHPIQACSNLYDLYYYTALNREAHKHKLAVANSYADKVKQLFENDSLISLAYHKLNNGKWNHMMSQTHIGYTYWQQPPVQTMPAVFYVSPDSVQSQNQPLAEGRKIFNNKKEKRKNHFIEFDGYISIEASHFTNAFNGVNISWKILPDHGRTGDAVTTFPVTAPEQTPSNGTPRLEYSFETRARGEIELHAFFSPTLNIYNDPEGLRYAVSIDDEPPQIISINKEDTSTGRGIWSKWVAENIIIKKSKHHIKNPGKHTVKYWMVSPAVVLQKLVLDTGGLKPGYLGPPESMRK